MATATAPALLAAAFAVLAAACAHLELPSGWILFAAGGCCLSAAGCLACSLSPLINPCALLGLGERERGGVTGEAIPTDELINNPPSKAAHGRVSE